MLAKNGIMDRKYPNVKIILFKFQFPHDTINRFRTLLFIVIISVFKIYLRTIWRSKMF